jgi:hypothetical protein
MGGEEFACKYRDQLLHELEDSYLQFKVVMLAFLSRCCNAWKYYLKGLSEESAFDDIRYKVSYRPK